MFEVKPLNSYRPPSYPVAGEMGLAELSHAPKRWSRLKSVVATLGTVAMTMKAFAQDAVPPEKPVAAQCPHKFAAKDGCCERQNATATDVCPLLPVAVAGAGRGGFGCVAVNPPVVLSECEALEIIEREFAKRGIRLKDCPEIEDVELPSKPGKRSRVMLDFGSEKGDILVEYLTHMDHERWEKPKKDHTYSSFNEYDVRAVAERAVAALETRKEGRPVSVGVLYDPLIVMQSDWLPSDSNSVMTASGEVDQGRLWNMRAAAGRKLAEERLLAQLEGFFAYLAKKRKDPGAK